MRHRAPRPAREPARVGAGPAAPSPRGSPPVGPARAHLRGPRAPHACPPPGTSRRRLALALSVRPSERARAPRQGAPARGRARRTAGVAPSRSARTRRWPAPTRGAGRPPAPPDRGRRGRRATCEHWPPARDGERDRAPEPEGRPSGSRAAAQRARGPPPSRPRTSPPASAGAPRVARPSRAAARSAAEGPPPHLLLGRAPSALSRRHRVGVR
jgi:hypothetical protein